ncbi:RagB/SusD family nutrient uptake outer membrane protein [Seonamhaeicola sp.]|uniref:RagB/SusD family nutrient uptake outer membrane protein n=1 Tax=Seonamhaeicola sp. TaxID=1912245 RepID=UPI002632F3CD|nr:RagB/SusD family nutrient uptake outer membrane protein [Seonamhaeicola sp.]
MLLGSSCDSFLEETPTSFISPDNFFATEADAEAAVVACYNKLGAGNKGTHGDWRDWIFEYINDDFKSRPASGTINVSLFISMVPEEPMIFESYRSFTSGLNTFNSAIEGIGAMEDFNQKEALISEAKFIRAYIYFHLVRLWGRVPLYENVLTAEEALSLERVDNIDKIYTLIVEDLEYAVANLPEVQTLEGRATKWAAMSLLSKVYLTQENWTNAAQLAKEVIDQGPHSLLENYGDVFDDANENNNESIFEIQMQIGVEKSNQVANWPRGIGATGADDYFLGPNWGGVYIATDDLLNDFEAGDDRRNYIATSVVRSDGTLIEFNADGLTPNYSIKRTPTAYIEGLESNNNSSYNFIYLRLADVYLMAAEAENEVNGPSGALMYINEVRNRAGLANLEVVNPSASVDQSIFREAVRKERRTELYDERHRLFDLLRWGNLVSNVQAARPDVSIQPHHVLWPIPVSAILNNPGLEGDQNPGYTD